MDSCIHFLRVSYKSGNFRLKTTWQGNEFDMMILEKSNAFKANINEMYISKLAEEYKVPLDEYVSKLKMSLCNNVQQEYTYDIQNNEFEIYKREDNISFLFFSIKLKSIDYRICSETFIDDFIHVNDKSENKLSILENEKDAAIKAQQLSENKLKSFLKTKEETEKILYSNFLLLLNEKKKRIQYLQELLNNSKFDEQIKTDLEEQSKNVNDSEMEYHETISTSESENEVGNEDMKSPSENENENELNFQSLAGCSKAPLVETQTVCLQKNVLRYDNSVNDFNMNEEVNNTESSDDINFSTQDILDRM